MTLETDYLCRHCKNPVELVFQLGRKLDGSDDRDYPTLLAQCICTTVPLVQGNAGVETWVSKAVFREKNGGDNTDA